jgi:hypothetical protein
MMRKVLVLTMAIVLFACDASRTPGSDSGTQASSTDPAIVDSLIGWAATDFRAQRGPKPVRFRAVHSGHVATAGDERQYRLCGEYSPASQGDAEWIPFATIRTSPYEQWLGGSALGYCNDTALVRDADDLSARMLSRFDSVR